MARERIPQAEVFSWLNQHFPGLEAEADRHWVWITTNLAGDKNKATREAIKEYGFRFAKRFHSLPSGKLGTWGHSCNKPMPFKRKFSKPQSNPQPEPQQVDESTDALAFALGY